MNDETLLLLFRDPPAALLGLSLIAKAGFDPSEGDDPLLERSAHSVPYSLLPQAELDPAESKAGAELLDGSKSEAPVKRRGRGTFSVDTGGQFDLPALASDQPSDWNLAPGVDANARIAIRYATESDTKLRTDAKQSEWYKKHGYRAGKETASGRRELGRREGDEELSWQGRETGDGRKFARRLGRERVDPYARPRDRRDGREGRERRTVDDLDQELERIAQRRSGAEAGQSMEIDADVEMEEQRERRSQRNDRGGRGQRGERRERRGKEDLDKGELGSQAECQS